MSEKISKEGLEKLKKELEVLKTEKRKEISEKLKHAISFGDLSENAAYTEAKEAQAFLEGEIARIDNIVRNAVVVENNEEEEKEEVEAGCNVFLIKDGEEAAYSVVSPSEANLAEGKISYESPLGKALLGKKVGEEFEFETPAKKFKCKVLKIS